MTSSLLRFLPRSPLRQKWPPLNFNNPNYGVIHPDLKIEEETVPGYIASRYYPMKIGEVIKDRYQVVTKLGYQKYVTLKVFIDKASMGKYVDDELNIYKRIQSSSKSTWPWPSTSHPGHDAIRSLTDHFDIDGTEHKHRCFVHQPLFESVWVFLHRNPIGRLPVPVLAVTLKRLFQALDYLHTNCRVIHTDISATNLLFAYKDNSAFAQAEQEELQDPSPRKGVDDNRPIYLFRDLSVQPGNMVPSVLVDFGSAVFGDGEHTEDIQPNHYRAPEVILGVPWDYKVDIWNVGCMIWDIFQGESLFTGYDPEHDAYRSRAHLAGMIDLLGPPPVELLKKGKDTVRSFDEAGQLRYGWLLKGITPLEERETTLKCDGDREDRELFLKFMGKMLKWEPRERATAGELVEDEWIVKHSS
ncbi:kinase-like domain-containing protein [Aspergillus stella-maris]|uniref:kinase-like domain-containing protein n=1 Tax=Aspergillus stella-maris TaxID=1810926 RepID=UPI003CCD8FCD